MWENGSIMTKKQSSYNAEMVAGSLLERESRVIAQLLLDGTDDKTWNDKLLHENVLQKRSIKTIKRLASLIRNRIEPFGKDGWKLISKGSAEVTKQMLLAACIKHNRLFGDFVLKVVKDQIRLFQKSLSKRSWVTFLEEATQQDGAIGSWAESTKEKLGQVTMRILEQVGIIENPRSLKFTPFFLNPQVAAYLRKHDETYILKCLELS